MTGGGNRFSKAKGTGTGPNTNNSSASKAAKTPDEQVPILRYGSGNNFVEFKKRISIAALDRFKNLARLFETEAYWLPPAIDPTNYQLANDPNGIHKLALQEDVKARMKCINEMKDQRPAMYAYVLFKLSVESEDALKRHDDYDKFDAAKDPLLLWKAVKEIHLVTTSSKMDIVVKKAARDEYAKTRMGEYETISAFKERFSIRYQAMVDQGNSELSDEDAALDFLESLHPTRYGSFIAEVINAATQDATKKPKDVNEVYTWAVSRVVYVEKPNNNSIGAAYHTAELSGAKPVDKSRHKPNKRDEKKPQKNYNKDQKVSPRDKSKDLCYNCGRMGHHMKDCPSEPAVMAATVSFQDAEKTVEAPCTCPVMCHTCETPVIEVPIIEEPSSENAKAPHEPVAAEEGEVPPSIGEDQVCCATIRAINSEVLLDTASQVSVFHPAHLTGIRQGKCGFAGLAGDVKRTNQVGTLPGFFEVIACADCSANILSLAQVERVHKVVYDEGRFTVRMMDRNVIFRRKNDLYVADISDLIGPPKRDWIKGLQEIRKSKKTSYGRRKSNGKRHNNRKPKPTPLTGTEFIEKVLRKSGYHRQFAGVHSRAPAYAQVHPKVTSLTPTELRKANEAGEFIRNAAFPSMEAAISMVRNGNINGISVSTQDIRNYFYLYGPPVETFRGKETRKKPMRASDYDPSLVEERIFQDFTSDIMHIAGEHFLVSICSPLELLIVSHVVDETAETLGPTLQKQMSVVTDRGFVVKKIRVDPQRSLNCLVGTFPGAHVDVSGASDHLPKVDIHIRRIKESVRSIIAGLPYAVSRARLRDLVNYVAVRLNARCTKARSNHIAPRVALTGQKLNYRTDFALKFGDYCEVFNPKARSNNAFDMRTEPCLALYPSQNNSGSWLFYNLKTKQYVKRSRWRKMNLNHAVQDMINRESIQSVVAPIDVTDSVPITDDIDAVAYVPPVPPTISPRNLERPITTVAEAKADAEFHGDFGEPNDEDHPKEYPVVEHPIDVEPFVDAPSCDGVEIGEVRRGSRPRHEPDRLSPNWDSKVYSNISVPSGIKRYGDIARNAVRDELVQLFENKKALIPVLKSQLSSAHRGKILRSHMFLKRKVDGFGHFEKMKARLVADGRGQSKEDIDDCYSPTASIDSIIAVLKQTSIEDREVLVLDVGSAYLNATLQDDVYMELSPLLTDLAVQYIDGAENCVEGGRLVVKLDKALYGLAESAKLWFETLTLVLENDGFTSNPQDACVWNKVHDGAMVTIIIYVDDLFISSRSKAVIEHVKSIIEREFKEVKCKTGREITYLGMLLRFFDSRIEIDMTAYIDSILEMYSDSGLIREYVSPSDADLHEVPEDSPHLVEQEKFHTVPAKLLYLATRGRPDVLHAVQFLCTRVTKATRDDARKLHRILGYLKATRLRTRIIHNDAFDRVTAYVDASFCVHPDGYGHTGCVLFAGDSAVMIKSAKHGIATKDSTEAELVALSDMLGKVEWLHEFFEGQGMKLNKPLVFQDNQSCIEWVTSSNNKRLRTKHLTARKSCVHEAIEEGRIEIGYCSTKRMIADMLTKSLPGFIMSTFIFIIMGLMRPLHDIASRGAKEIGNRFGYYHDLSRIGTERSVEVTEETRRPYKGPIGPRTS